MRYANAAERVLAAIGEPQMVDTAKDPRLGRIFLNRTIRIYPAFAGFYGMEETIERIVSFFRHAAQGLEERKQILYLLGPVGSGKSSLAERLKALMEMHPIYALKAGEDISPVFESPLGLFDPLAPEATKEPEPQGWNDLPRKADPAQLQARLLAARNERQSKAALLASGVFVLIQFALFLLVGAVLFVYYRLSPPATPFVKADDIFPTFIVTRMPHGISGLLIAAILAAAMSNLSAALNSLSSSSIIDFYQRLRPNATERRRTGKTVIRVRP